jgi:hypothetical protein
MKQFCGRLLLAAGALVTCVIGRAPAQFAPPRFGGIAPVTQPAVSPYLNLLRRDNPAYLNYYGLVRPEVEFRNSINRLQQQVNTNQESISNLESTTPLPVTGHPAYFLNTARYFLTQNAPAAAGGGLTGATGSRPAATLAPPAAGRPGLPTLPARR